MIVVTPNAEKINDSFQTVGKKKKRKGKSKSINGGQFSGLSVKHNVRYEPKATTSAPKKGTTFVGYTSQSTPMLKTTEEEDDEEDVKNVYDESANLIQNTKVGGSSSFMAATGINLCEPKRKGLKYTEPNTLHPVMEQPLQSSQIHCRLSKTRLQEQRRDEQLIGSVALKRSGISRS
ncbi:hypothetical protein Tco_1015202 [Tanacetum coccineum]|uniref:Uncharacterized protein n=1 Tax=Tanacetum coccineum TaxID=301880 RepID=A0ABQ5FK81_9ASTR